MGVGSWELGGKRESEKRKKRRGGETGKRRYAVCQVCSVCLVDYQRNERSGEERIGATERGKRRIGATERGRTGERAKRYRILDAGFAVC